MPWPTERRHLGQATPRLDGAAKVSGSAKYAYDVNLPGLLYAVVLYSPHGRARITKLNTDPARRSPGVRALAARRQVGSELRYHGEYIAAVAADTEAQARDAIRAIQIEYEVLPSCATEEAALAADAPKLLNEGNVSRGEPRSRGDVDSGLRAGAATYENTFRCAVMTHACLETHGGVVQYEDGGKVTVWSSTQAVAGVRNDLARSLQKSPADVEVICEYMGGGFGGKLGGTMEESTAAELARQAGRPVKLLLDREQDQTFAGCCRSIVATVKLAADANGRLTGADCSSYGTGGIGGRGGISFPYIYNVGASRHQHTDVFTNQGNMRALRAPGSPKSSWVMESAMDGLAEKLGIDPVLFRQRNLPQGSYWVRQLSEGAQRIGWDQRPKTGSQTGRYRTGYGCALAQWGGGGHDSNARVAIHHDGKVEIWCATQDIGTGSRTVMAVVAAETLGLNPTDITVYVGRGSYPPSGGSGGSTTIGGIAPAARAASEAALAKLFERIAPGLGAAPGDLEAYPGGIRRKGQTGGLSWQEACGRLGPETIDVTAAKDRSLGGSGVNGAQFAKATVDTETGVIKLDRIVAIQDCGLVVNRLTCESQIFGAVTMGIGLALFEQRILDPTSARMLNPNLEFYKLAGASDIPPIEVLLEDHPERGVIGVGEPPYIPTAAAIGNAVANALGVRVTDIPLTPAKVLAALAGKGGSA
ncbi:MAG: xanthine dehydrogenase family protein molybdopterin-binding subunit [Fimbriimonadaceae bacterium]|nr:xanthine dehydrogenase family protein molybdopterin-binding subunit [Fimbriimonadaceae bacterium]